jgi:phosphate transport system permease protein
VNKLEFGDSILAGGLTLGLLVLPVIIRTTEESLKAVDDTFRQASLGLGASKWETTSKIVFPIAFLILLRIILSIGRVSGETAPILFTVAAYFFT